MKQSLAYITTITHRHCAIQQSDIITKDPEKSLLLIACRNRNIIEPNEGNMNNIEVRRTNQNTARV